MDEFTTEEEWVAYIKELHDKGYTLSVIDAAKIIHKKYWEEKLGAQK